VWDVTPPIVLEKVGLLKSKVESGREKLKA